ncbi:MAG: 2-dehydropantoate 2-reductase [Myxococcales bacterium]
MDAPLICVYGAGSVGCYVGGRLLASGARVHLVGRPAMVAQLRTHGLHVSDYRGAELHVPADKVMAGSDVDRARAASLVLVCVKSAATQQAAEQLASALRPGTLVLSLQNGLHNARVLSRLLPRCRVLAGMVQFNVVQRGQGAFHQGSEGGLSAERVFGLAPFVDTFTRAGLSLDLHDDLERVQWAKLLLNLNNPINALSDLPLKEELAQRAFRRCLGLAQAEALALLSRTDIQPARLTPLPPRWMARLLGVPDFLFEVAGRNTLAIDPLARSSMWDDLERGRPTEIDFINGEVVQLGEQLGQPVPVNARLVALIKQAEQGGKRRFGGPELWAELQRSQRT